MSRFSLRPSSTTINLPILPGKVDTKAHAGKPKNGQQSHHKLQTLDALVAKNEILAKETDPLKRASAFIEGPATTEEQPIKPPRRGLAKLKKTLFGAAKVMGLARGEPVPRSELVRYAGTSPEDDTREDDSAIPGDPKRLISSFVAVLGIEQDAMDARIAVNEAAASEEVLAGHVERIDGDIALSARRASNLADRLHHLTQRNIDAAAELATARESIETTKVVLASTQDLLKRTSDELEEELDALRRLIGAAPYRRTDDLDERSSSLAGLWRQEREQKIADLKADMALLREVEAHKLEALSQFQTKLVELPLLQEKLDNEITQTRHIARVNEKALWQHSHEADALRALQEPLQKVVQDRKTAQEPVDVRTGEALAALSESDKTNCDELLVACPGFSASADLQPLREAVDAWSGTLEDRLTTFGAEALPKSLAMNIAFEALGIVTCGDAERAARLVRELQTLPLAALVPPEGVASESPQISVAAQDLARLLADEPSGLQMLELLLAPTGVRLGKQQEEAARLYLLADVAKSKLPPRVDGPLPGVLPTIAEDDDDTVPERPPLEATDALRGWIASAQRAASRMVHAADPSLALADCTVDERAAYRAFRNGFDSNAPGSDYDKANQHLKKPVQWLKDRASPNPIPLAGPPNPLNALPEGLVLGAANAMPTPRRQAAKALEEAADHLNNFLAARNAQLPPGQTPSPGELAWQAIAHYVQWHPEGSDLTTMKLDAKALREIDERRLDIQQQFEKEARRHGGDPGMASTVHPALDAAWREVKSGKLSVLEAMNMLHERLPASVPPSQEASTSHMAYWPAQEAVLRTRLHDAVSNANRLLHDGDPARVTTGKALFDLSRDMIENLEWRDKVRFIGQKVWGANVGPLSAGIGIASMPTGIGVKLVAAGQQNQDELMEIYMGRTGLYLQLGEQTTRQVQLGAGTNVGYVWSIGDEETGARAGVGGNADWRMKREIGVESGVQLRVLRLTKGEEPELMAKFMDMYEHLLTLAASHEGDTPAPDDWLREILAHHPNLNIGLIDRAVRESTGTESNLAFFAGARLGEVNDRPRRVNLSISAGVKAKSDDARTQTEVAGYMTTLYRDSTAQAKVEVNARAAVGVQVHQWSKENLETGNTDQKASIGANGIDLAYAAEVRAAGVTHFCTLFTIDKKIDPVRSDCAMDFQDFEAFEQEVRREWPAWVNYGTGKLPADMSEGMRYAVSEKQLENLLENGRLFAKGNKFATAYMDKALKPKVTPMLDGLRTLAGLQRKAGRSTDAERTDRNFDDMVAQPAMWEPSILVLREKPKLQVERGVDWFLKYQKNRIAEGMRTVAQWPLYEPVPRAEPGHRPEPARLWNTEAPGQRRL